MTDGLDKVTVNVYRDREYRPDDETLLLCSSWANRIELTLTSRSHHCGVSLDRVEVQRLEEQLQEWLQR